MVKGGKKLRLESQKPSFGDVKLNTTDVQESKISFSFEYFEQTKMFGLGDCSRRWFVALIMRLKSLGSFAYSDLQREGNNRNANLRFHPIDWSNKNIPIQRRDLVWLPEKIRNNEEEFPFHQISLSTGRGRIVGYFGIGYSVFYVVLLDPNHNIQPSNKHNYQLRPTTIGLSEYDDLILKMKNVEELIASCQCECKLCGQLMQKDLQIDNMVYVGLDWDFYEKYTALIEKHSVREILECGILNLDD